MARVLVLAGDAAEDLEVMYVKYRLAEAGYDVDVAAPTTRPIKLVVHDFEDGFDAAGGIWVDEPDCVDGNLVSCRGWGDLAEWSRAYVGALASVKEPAVSSAT